MKIDKKPLLEHGFKEISLYQLDKFFLDPFQNKERRLLLITKLKQFLDLFQSLGIKAEVWIDGSFVTWKDDPDDIDLAFLLNETEVNTISPEKQMLFRQLMIETKKVKIRYLLDVHYFDNKNVEQRKYYQNLFGLERDNLNQKGIFKLLI